MINIQEHQQDIQEHQQDIQEHQQDIQAKDEHIAMDLKDGVIQQLQDELEVRKVKPNTVHEPSVYIASTTRHNIAIMHVIQHDVSQLGF